MKCDSIPKSFGHSRKIERLKTFFLKNENKVTPEMFDKEFSPSKICEEFEFQSTISPILGIMGQGREWFVYLDLFQIMVQYGWATIEGKMPDVTYSLL